MNRVSDKHLVGGEPGEGEGRSQRVWEASVEALSITLMETGSRRKVLHRGVM